MGLWRNNRGYLSLNEVPGVGPWSHRISVLIKRDQRLCSLLLLFLSVSTCTPRKCWVCKPRRESSPATETWPWSGTSSLQKCETINVCCLSLPVCGILLWQPGQTNSPGDRRRCDQRWWRAAKIRFLYSVAINFLVNILTIRHLNDKSPLSNSELEMHNH